MIGSCCEESRTRYYVYESINNRLLKHDSNQANAVYTYDAHGNMLTMPHLPIMEWDSVDHLHKSVRGNDTTWYKYDVDGNRRRKITDKPGGIKEERIYHGDYEVYRKYVNDVLQEETRTVHVSDGERRIATVDYKTIENGVAITSFNDIVRYQYDNHLGSACLELDANALTITYEEYHPFGTSSYKLADNETEVKRKRYRYVGKERDEETGLYYYGARYYAAWIARFVSVDPMANQRTWVSPYNYCQNNPINRTDSNGALDTWYTDKKGNVLMQTNDGSNDVVTVPDSKVEDFKYYNQSYKNSQGMKDVYESQGWNNNWKYEFGLGKAQLSDKQISHLGMLNSDWSRENAVEFWLNPTIENSTAASFSEALSQWTNPYLVIGGLSAGIASFESMANTTLYRGVNEVHPGYANAIEGTAIPRGGNASAAQHTVGNTNSIFTSWSTDFNVAKNFATRPSGSGVVLKINTSKGIFVNNSKSVILKQTGKLVSESEVLMQGVVKGAEIFKVK